MEKRLCLFFYQIGLYDEKMFQYIQNHKIEIKNKEDIPIFVGCFPIVKDGILKSFKMFVPSGNEFIYDLMKVHECGHAIALYKCLNKKYVDQKYSEIFPILLERLYSRSIGREEEYLRIQRNNLNDLLENELYDRYKIALDMQEELINSNFNDFEFSSGCLKIRRK